MNLSLETTARSTEDFIFTRRRLTRVLICECSSRHHLSGIGHIGIAIAFNVCNPPRGGSSAIPSNPVRCPRQSPVRSYGFRCRRTPTARRTDKIPSPIGLGYLGLNPVRFLLARAYRLTPAGMRLPHPAPPAPCTFPSARVPCSVRRRETVIHDRWTRQRS